MTRLGARAAATLCALLALRAGLALATPLVLQGDPIDPSTGSPWILLPGVPLVHWGEDEKWRTDDDVVDPGIVGDVDVVVRAGGTYGGGTTLPPPWHGVAAAPEVVAGGVVLSDAGTEATVQVVLSDGAPAPSGGHALLADDMDGRGVVVLAYPDLDGDGVIGRTAADGTGDDAIEAQEALQVAGRRLGVVQGGVSSGALATSLGAPKSAGGLGLLLVAGVLTGERAPVYDDAGWIATLLPAMWPPETRRIVGNNPRPPDPLALYDLEVEVERMFRPAPGHPVLGTPYAIPLDGSSVTNDVLRAVSGPATAVAFARRVAASFVADPLVVLRPIVDAAGARAVVQTVDTLSLRKARGRSTMLLHPSDLLGNASDPPSGGLEARLEASNGLRIATPDADGDPRHETVVFAAPNAVRVKLVENAAHDGGRSGTLVAVVDGAPATALSVLLDGRGSVAPQPIVRARATLERGTPAGTHRLALRTFFDADPTTFDPARQALTVVLRDMHGNAYERTIAAGALRPNAAGTVLRFKDPRGVPGRIRSLVLQRSSEAPERYRLDVRAMALDLGVLDAVPAALDHRVVVGAARFGATLGCSPVGPDGTLACSR